MPDPDQVLMTSPGPLRLQGRKGLVGSEVQGIRKEKTEKSLATWVHWSHYV